MSRAAQSQESDAEPDIVIDFLTRFHGGAPWHLVAIRPKTSDNTAPPIVCKSFTDGPDRREQVAAWIASENRRNNIYFSINPLETGFKDKKATKKDVKEAAWLWADVGPPNHLPPLDGWRASSQFDRLPAGLPEPTVRIDSGRGYWHFWKLRTPQPVDGDDSHPLTARVESYGCGIERRYLSDNIRNIERIGRLPGTINHKTGLRAKLISFEPELVCAEEFPKFEEEKQAALHEEAPKFVALDFEKLPLKLQNIIMLNMKITRHGARRSSRPP